MMRGDGADPRYPVGNGNRVNGSKSIPRSPAKPPLHVKPLNIVDCGSSQNSPSKKKHSLSKQQALPSLGASADSAHHFDQQGIPIGYQGHAYLSSPNRPHPQRRGGSAPTSTDHASKHTKIFSSMHHDQLGRANHQEVSAGDPRILRDQCGRSNSTPGILEGSLESMSNFVNYEDDNMDYVALDATDRMNTLLNLSEQVEKFNSNERDRQRRDHQQRMVIRQKIRKQAHTVTLDKHFAGTELLEKKIGSEQQRQREALEAKLKQRRSRSTANGRVSTDTTSAGALNALPDTVDEAMDSSNTPKSE